MSRYGIVRDADFYRRQDEYFRQVNESDGFDIEGIIGPQGMAGALIPVSCQGSNRGYPYGPLVKRYAMVGLHRYNMLEGTNFKLSALIKFNMTMNCANSFFITLAARDKDSMQTFQVQVDEERYGLLDVTCSVARVKGEGTSEPYDCSAVDNGLPDWPSDDDAFNDKGKILRGKNGLYVEKLALLDTDWIRIYLELAVYTNDRMILEEDLSKLSIVKVAIETTEEAPLNAKTAIVYIAFKGLATGGIGEHVERKAIIKRILNERTGYLYLKGHLCRGEEDLTLPSWEEIIKQQIQSLDARVRRRVGCRVGPKSFSKLTRRLGLFMAV